MRPYVTTYAHPLTDAERVALLVYLDAVLAAWALSPPDSKVEEVLSDSIDETCDRLGMPRIEQNMMVDGACKTALAMDVCEAIESAFEEPVEP